MKEYHGPTEEWTLAYETDPRELWSTQAFLFWLKILFQSLTPVETIAAQFPRFLKDMKPSWHVIQDRFTTPLVTERDDRGRLHGVHTSEKDVDTWNAGIRDILHISGTNAESISLRFSVSAQDK